MLSASPRLPGLARSRRHLSLIAPVLIAAAVAGPAVVTPAQAVARTTAKSLACHASVSTAHPEDYSTVVVYVSTVSNAQVSTAAHYKTTTHVESAKANRRGQASTSYDISDATTGYQVIVTISVPKRKPVGQLPDLLHAGVDGSLTTRPVRSAAGKSERRPSPNARPTTSRSAECLDAYAVGAAISELRVDFGSVLDSLLVPIAGGCRRRYDD